MPAFDSSVGGLLSTSYVSLVEALDALSLLVSPEQLADWSAEPQAVQENYLMRSTKIIDGSFVWNGFRANSGQMLSFPRARVYVDGRYLPSDAIPPTLIDATSLFAVYLYEGFNFANSTATPVKEVKIGPIEVVFDSSKNVTSPLSLPAEIIEMLQSLGNFSGASPGAKVIDLERA